MSFFFVFFVRYVSVLYLPTVVKFVDVTSWNSFQLRVPFWLSPSQMSFYLLDMGKGSREDESYCLLRSVRRTGLWRSTRLKGPYWDLDLKKFTLYRTWNLQLFMEVLKILLFIRFTWFGHGPGPNNFWYKDSSESRSHWEFLRDPFFFSGFQKWVKGISTSEWSLIVVSSQTSLRPHRRFSVLFFDVVHEGTTECRTNDSPIHLLNTQRFHYVLRLVEIRLWPIVFV